MKNNKGITLVALVVTIVVLLILAGVSINLVLGNNGIIAKAKDAQRESAEASQNDLKGMNALTEEMNNALGEKPKVDLSKYKIGDLVNYTPNTEKSESTVNESESGTSEQKVAKDATLKWKILNIDEVIQQINSKLEKDVDEKSNRKTKRDAPSECGGES